MVKQHKMLEIQRLITVNEKGTLQQLCSQLAKNSPGCASDQMDMDLSGMMSILSCLLGGMMYDGFDGSTILEWVPRADTKKRGRWRCKNITAANSSISFVAPCEKLLDFEHFLLFCLRCSTFIETQFTYVHLFTSTHHGVDVPKSQGSENLSKELQTFRTSNYKCKSSQNSREQIFKGKQSVEEKCKKVPRGRTRTKKGTRE